MTEKKKFTFKTLQETLFRSFGGRRFGTVFRTAALGFALTLPIMPGFITVGGGVQAFIIQSVNSTASRWDFSPLSKAVQKGEIESVKKLLAAGAEYDDKNNALLTAARLGRASIVRILLEAGADVNAADDKGNTPLLAASGRTEEWYNHGWILDFANNDGRSRKTDAGAEIPEATEEEKKETIEILLEAGADVNAVNSNSVTPLIRAVQNNNIETMKIFLRAGADVNAADDLKETPLMTAVKNGNPEAVTILLGAGADVNAANDEKTTPLMLAAKNGNPETVTILLGAGAEVNAISSYGTTPLMLAVKNGPSEMVSLLLEAGADIHARTQSGNSALSYAVDADDPKIIDTLLEREYRLAPTPQIELFLAAFRGETEKVRSLLDAGEGFRSKQDAEAKALLWAIEGGKTETVRALIKAGADVNREENGVIDDGRPLEENGGVTPLFCAVKNHQKEIVQLLIESGAKLNAKKNIYSTVTRTLSNRQEDFVEITELMLAVQLQEREIVKILLDAGADVNAVSGQNGNTALMMAVKCDTDLIYKTRSVHYKTSPVGGDSAEEGENSGDQGTSIAFDVVGGKFRETIEKENGDTFKLLLDAGADIDIRNDENKSAFDIALNLNREKMLKMLLDAGYKGDSLDDALVMVLARGKTKLADILIDAGAGLRAQNSAYKALTVVAGMGNLRLVQKLLDRGADSFDKNNALYAAAYYGQAETVQILLTAGADVNAAGTDGNTPLIMAVQDEETWKNEQNSRYYGDEAKKPFVFPWSATPSEQDKTETVRALLRGGADLNAVGADGKTALHWAVLGGQTELVQILIEAGADHSGGGSKKIPVLQTAIKSRQTKIVKMLLDAGADLHPRGINLLALAAETKGNEEIVKMLLAAGVDSGNGEITGSAFRSAAKNGHYEIMKILFEGGAYDRQRDFTKNAEGISVLGILLKQMMDPGRPTVSMRNGQNEAKSPDSLRKEISDVIELILKEGCRSQWSKHCELLEAAFLGETEKVKTLLRDGAQVNGSAEGPSPLLLASARRQVETVKALLAAGADFLEEWEGMTPILMAEELDSAELIQMFIDAGADIGSMNRGGEIVIQAVKNGRANILKIFLDAGIDIGRLNYPDYLYYPNYSGSPHSWNKDTPLGAAVRCRQKEIVKMLLNAGIRPQGSREVFSAVFEEECDILRMLIDAGADVNAKNEEELTPLIAAVKFQKMDSLRTLLRGGADINGKGRNESTPLLVAAVKTEAETVKTLLKAGADPNLTDSSGRSALILALLDYQERVKIIQEYLFDSSSDRFQSLRFANERMEEQNRVEKTVLVLIDGGADVSQRLDDGTTVLTLAVRSRKPKLVRAVLDVRSEHGFQGDDLKKAFTLATQNNDKTIVKLILDADRTGDPSENSQLFLAAYNGDAETVKKLLAAGADANAEKSGLTALMLAVDNNQPEIVRLLLDAGADLNATDNTGNTVFIKAMVSGHKEIARMLLDAGADPESKEKGENAPSAADAGAVETGSDVPMPDREGNLPAKRQRDAAVHQALQDDGVHADTAVGFKKGVFLKGAKSGETETVKKCLVDGVDINMKDKDGNTALFLAAKNGHTETVRLLLDAGAKPSASNVELFSAIENGQSEIVRLLIQSGSDVNAQGAGGTVPLLTAVKCGQAQMVKILLDAGAETGAKDADGATALYAAAVDGDTEVLRLLLDAGADVNAAANGGETPLVAAVKNGAVANVWLLLDAGADVNAVNGKGETAFRLALDGNKTELVKMLLKAGVDDRSAKNTPFFGAVLDGNADAVRKLIEEGADPRIPYHGTTALIMAVKNRHQETAELLIDAGVDVNAKDSAQDTALMTAADGDQFKILRRLIEAGADVNAVNRDGKTALMFAVKSGNAASVQLLLDSKADVAVKDNEGMSAVDYYGFHQNKEIFQKLIDAGADRHAVTQSLYK